MYCSTAVTLITAYSFSKYGADQPFVLQGMESANVSKINIFSVFPHSHLAGKAMSLHHVR